jgi:hypothetical protein
MMNVYVILRQSYYVLRAEPFDLLGDEPRKEEP